MAANTRKKGVHYNYNRCSYKSRSRDTLKDANKHYIAPFTAYLIRPLLGEGGGG